MINEFSVKAKPSGNKATVAFTVLLIAAAALVLVYSIIPLYKGIVGVGAMACICAAVLIYTKYVSAIYYYDITFDYRGEPLFVVRQVVGKRQSTLARLGLRDIRTVELEDSVARRAHKTEKGVRKYSYLPTLMPETVCRITAKNQYERCEMLIECSSEFAELLRSYAAEARTFVIADDDED